MLYIVAILCPPLAVLLCGKPIQAILNVVLSFLLYFPGMLHALVVVADHNADKRTARLERALRRA